MGNKGLEVRKLYEYLKRFGYFPNDALSDFRNWQPAIDNDIEDPEHFDENLATAVRLFQEQNGLKRDGAVGPKTLALIATPRCGVPDVVHAAAGPLPFVASGYSWDNLSLTYSFVNTGADRTAAEVRAAVRGAFDRWSAVSPLRFNEVVGASDIQIGWYSGNHGDGNAFDGSGNVLAHCFSPPPGGGSFSGDVHFDEAETWTVDTPPRGIDLATVALHEIGHGLGLNHSSDTSSVMFASYVGMRRDLTPDDIAGISAIYGGRRQPFPVISWGPGRLDIFGLGLDRQMYHRAWENGWYPSP
ncbi:matrixin family metalloprotease, partial [Streptosporangium subroseum]|uniref:matrixin family metalloprotease n=1 Tax=Streptosporangium subroseum TaxID=106412 RepID=UPI0015C67A97